MRDDSEFFVTASCLTIDPKTRILRVASAGHLPLIMRRASGEVFTFGAASGTPLGMLPTDYTDEELQLDPGDIVLMMTDGLVEALDRLIAPEEAQALRRRLDRLIARGKHPEPGRGYNVPWPPV